MPLQHGEIELYRLTILMMVSAAHIICTQWQDNRYLKNVHGLMCLQRLKKIMKILRCDSWYKDDLNLRPAYYAGRLPT